MEREVIKQFRDKETGRLMLPGQTFSSDDEKRVNALVKKGFVTEDELVPKPAKKDSAVTKKEVPAKRDSVKPAAGDGADVPAE
ncbi:hypothetical protein [Paenibacillus typhae]|uniref:hypothetical protein n=1 Tax=Paenibacillus typhae TaxID=1174501 RepID=UPI001C8DA3A4|nr:hypothetical protein [Paenibacillus typhae]MBY0011494.1 hypothetical protein [Paenibacillus typhae]